ncbi:MAG: 4-alpha-glucanotransferase [Deltaproteobacteria bacterium]|nr:4-alpha-glucanotransferase [Deltaproteobacteria bacterium]
MDPTGARALPRVAGVTVPLFSLRGHGSWGLGDLGCLAPFGHWAREAGLKLVQLLPLNEIAGGDTSPYASITAFGMDPVYVSLGELPELDGDPEGALDEAGVAALEGLRHGPRVDHDGARALKLRALRVAFERFTGDQDHRAFLRENSAWLDDYALFRALKDAHQGAPWWRWEEGLRERDPAALARALDAHERAVGFHRYAQWRAHRQWEAARRALQALGVEVMGDLPFMVGRDSADVWSQRRFFRAEASVGVPPDQFDPDGQEWGLPPYRWDALRQDDFGWLRARSRHAGTLYDRFRVDHLVGFFRTYQRPVDRLRDARNKLLPGTFDPPTEALQKAHGVSVLAAMRDAARAVGSTLVAEDLGTIPDFVRPLLRDLDLPGYKVLMWEKAWKDPTQPYLDPQTYPVRSVACFGTHDTAPVSVWWNEAPRAEREALLALPSRARDQWLATEPYGPDVQTALLDTLLGAGSELVLLLAQEVLGVDDRVNLPSTVGPHNWSWRLPGSLDALRADPRVEASRARVREAIERHGR